LETRALKSGAQRVPRQPFEDAMHEIANGMVAVAVGCFAALCLLWLSACAPVCYSPSCNHPELTVTQ
jgi:hypothetical protein